MKSNGAQGSGGSAEDSELSDEDFSEDDVEDQLREYSAEMAGLTQEISIKVRAELLTIANLSKITLKGT